uniref:Myb/SANT-like domain-containing protein n=1 Tax=Lactuca sativa TaxID=4236 RepID=A0A9R1UX71_LACSA|nr:hypothetical protein LSAT_V11C700355610 [Lactuca sativa]
MVGNYRNRRITEDAKLVEALHLENALKEKIPSSGILGKPHIESRIKTMKKDWQVVYDMVNGTNKSDFGYYSSTHSLTAEPAVWDSYIQVHKEAGKWRNKIFPHYKDLCIIFGKDRAQGNKAKDFAQMEEDANNEEQSEQIEYENEESPNTTSKKRKRVDVVIKGITIAANVLGEKLEKTANSMDQAILGEKEVQKKKKKKKKKKTSMVIPKISKMQSLSVMDWFKASRKIICDPKTVLSFWNLEGEDQEDFVRFMLEE